MRVFRRRLFALGRRAVSITSGSILLLACLSGCPRRSTSSYRQPPPPPPCYPDGVYRVRAVRTGSSGSVCNLNDLRELSEEITIARNGAMSAHVHQRGRYAHQANLDPYACAVWTQRTPTHGRSLLGATVRGHAGYRVNLRPDGSLYGGLQLTVSCSSMLVAGCTATFQLTGQRVR